MGQVNRDALRTGAPKVTQDDLEGGNTLVLTIADYAEDQVDDAETEGGKRQVAYLTFEELGEKRLYLNVTQIDAIIEQYGDDSDDWKGKPLPVEKVTQSYGTQKYKKVWVVTDTDAWPEIFEEAGVTPKRRSTTKKKAKAKKRGR